MKKTIITVFLIIAALVLVLLIWELFFTKSGILHTAYNAMAGGVNSVFENFAGKDAKLLPLWDSDTSSAQYNSQNEGSKESGFKVDNKAE